MTSTTFNPTTILSLTADDWQLYDDMPDAAMAAAEINSAICMAFQAGKNRRGVKRAARKVMDRYSDVGARDTEPRQFLWSLIIELFRRCA